MSKRWRTARQYLLILCFSAVAAVTLAEWVLSRRASSIPTIPFYNRLYPYVMFRPLEKARFISHDVRLASNILSHNARTVHHFTNEAGFRVPALDYDLPKKKPAEQLRLAVLGSSAVQLGTTYDDTLPGSLRAVLRERHTGRDVEVINAGIQSCVSRQSIAHLLFTLVDYEPDIVVLYDGFNDLMLPLNYESRSNFPYNFQTMEAAWEQYRSERRDPLWQLALGRSYLYRALRARFVDSKEEKKGLYVGPNAKSPQEIVEDPAWARRHVAAYLSNWQKLIELSVAYGFRPVCVLQPTAVLDPGQGARVTAEAYQLDLSTATAWVHALSLLYEEASRQVEDLRRRYPDTGILDMSRALPAEGHFWDVVHVYDETNRLLAEKLVEKLPALGGGG